jgi:hypothetical protein
LIASKIKAEFELLVAEPSIRDGDRAEAELEITAFAQDTGVETKGLDWAFFPARAAQQRDGRVAKQPRLFGALWPHEHLSRLYRALAFKRGPFYELPP